MAIKSFADQATSDIFHGINSKHSRRIPQRVWTAARRKLDALQVASQTLDLNLRGMQFEPLKHDRPGYNSIRVNDQYRLIFQFQNGDAFNVAIEDFHGRRGA
jgi:proteic killer suppression protein